MRWPNDRRLAREVPEINLILGGHDHDYQCEEVSCGDPLSLSPLFPSPYYSIPQPVPPFPLSQINDTLVVKSGSDFRDFSKITVNFLQPRPTFDVDRKTITRDVPPDPEVAAMVASYCGNMEERMKEQIGRLVTPYHFLQL